jgi:cysteine desulfurase
MLHCMEDIRGNPSSIHAAGRAARVAVERAREHVAALLHADPGTIVFTSGGTEADALAINQAGREGRFDGILLASSMAEHQAVLRSFDHAVTLGATRMVIPTADGGVVHADALARELAPSVNFVSVMHANNETGALSDIAVCAATAHERDALFHSDMVQSAGKVAIDLPATAVDYAAISAHKIHGPKGIGALYVAAGRDCDPMIRGGAQERNRRGGTENVAAIVGFGEAARLTLLEREERNALWRVLRARFLEILLTSCKDAIVNEHAADGLPNIVSITFPSHRYAIDGESLLMMLDMAGLHVSSGSACTAGSFEASHVMRELGHDETSARASLRCSFGFRTRKEDVEEAAAIIIRTVQELAGRSSDRSHSRIAMP